MSAANEDIVAFDGTNFSLHFDGSDVGVGNLTLDAFSALNANEILMSFTDPATITGISGTVDDSDIVKFTATTFGSATAGSWALYFDGSDVGLTSSDEDVDAAAVHANGAISFSTTGNFSVTGVSGADEDVFTFTPSSLGSNTSGTFQPALFFDGSLYGLGSNDVFAIDLP